MDALGYRNWLNILNDRYDVPLFDVDNGLGAIDALVVEDGVKRVHDPYRIEYLRDHITNLRAAIDKDGVNILYVQDLGCFFHLKQLIYWPNKFILV